MASSQSDDDELKLLSIRNTGNALKFGFESESEKRRSSSSTQTTKNKRLLFEETVENRFNGSVYHPNLVSFDIDLENGLDHRKEESPPTTTGKLNTSNLNRFHAFSLFLRERPYAFSLKADRDRQVQNREFFERQVIDSTRDGGTFGLKNTFVPAVLSFNNNSQTISRATRPSQDYVDNKMDLSLNNISKKTGETRLDLSQDDFSRTETGLPQQSGTVREGRLFNQYLLFGDENKQFNTSVNQYKLTGTRASEFFNFDERFDIKHNQFLNSYYAYDFSDRSVNQSKSQDNRFNLGLKHRLYDSLNSILDLHYFKGNGSSFSQDIYGVSSDMDYIKKLGKIGRVGLGAGLTFDEESRETQGIMDSVLREAHTLTTGGVTLLDMPDVDESSVVVTDSTGTITYRVDVDYQLTPLGTRLQIQRVPGGSIPDGSQVLVDYRSKANSSSAFNTLLERYHFQMDFLDSLCGFSYRINRENHPSVAEIDNTTLQTLNDNIFATYIDIYHLRLEWETEDYNSSLSPYKRNGFKESWFYNLTERSTYTIQASQNRLRITNASELQKYYDVINRYSTTLNPATRLNIEAGYRNQRGDHIALDDWTARFSIDLNLGQFTMTTEYTYEDQVYLEEIRTNHFFLTKFKRTF